MTQGERILSCRFQRQHRRRGKRWRIPWRVQISLSWLYLPRLYACTFVQIFGSHDINMGVEWFFKTSLLRNLFEYWGNRWLLALNVSWTAVAGSAWRHVLHTTMVAHELCGSRSGNCSRRNLRTLFWHCNWANAMLVIRAATAIPYLQWTQLGMYIAAGREESPTYDFKCIWTMAKKLRREKKEGCISSS